MANHDPISDMLTRIRNASEKRHERTRIPASKLSRSIASVLQQEGFIAAISEEGEGVQSTSPPTPCLRASRSLITPLEVEMIATPRPPSTLGSWRVFL